MIVHPLNSLNQNNSRGAKIGARIKLEKRICGGTEFVHTPIFKLVEMSLKFSEFCYQDRSSFIRV